MLWTIAVIMLILWALGLITSYTMGGFIHILLVIAIVIVLMRANFGSRGRLSMPFRHCKTMYTGRHDTMNPRRFKMRALVIGRKRLFG
jgi:hypothetical protein